jgi:stage II sporulation protein D
VVTLVGLPGWGAMVSCQPAQAPDVSPPSDSPGAVEPSIIRVRLTPAIESARLSAGRGATFADAGGQPLAPAGGGEMTLRRRQGRWVLDNRSLPGDALALRPGPSPSTLNGRRYRGVLRCEPDGPDSFYVVNHLDIEDYLAGVLAKELYPGWHEEAYRAQAIVARTFAVYQRMTFGPSHRWDVVNHQGSQMYGGMDAETPKSRRAVDSTRGIVLAHGPDGDVRVFRAQYSSCCGGVTNPADVIQDSPDIPPLAGGQVCTDCSASSRYRWPAVRVDKAVAYRAVAKVRPDVAQAISGIDRVRPAHRAENGRTIWLWLVDRSGRRFRLRSEVLRLALLRHGGPEGDKLYSMNCRILDQGPALTFTDGRGFGHGVGLCQFGTEGKARKGWPAFRIVRYYYPGARLIKLY